MPAIMVRVLATVFLWCVMVVIVLVAVPLVGVVALFTAPFDPNRRAAGQVLRALGSSLFRLNPLWWGRVEGKLPNLRKQACVVVCNHESNVDVVFLSRLPYEMKWMAKASLFRVPWFGLLFRLSGDIPVDREDRTKGQEAMEKARAYLRRGMSVMIFPEGTRTRDGRLGAFKPGAFRIAVDTGVPIVPIAVHGTSEGMTVGSPILRPARPVARILPPVPTVGLTAEDVPALIEQVRGQIAAARDALAAERKGPERPPAAQPTEPVAGV